MNKNLITADEIIRRKSIAPSSLIVDDGQAYDDSNLRSSAFKNRRKSIVPLQIQTGPDQSDVHTVELEVYNYENLSRPSMGARPSIGVRLSQTGFGQDQGRSSAGGWNRAKSTVLNPTTVITEMKREVTTRNSKLLINGSNTNLNSRPSNSRRPSAFRNSTLGNRPIIRVASDPELSKIETQNLVLPLFKDYPQKSSTNLATAVDTIGGFGGLVLPPIQIDLSKLSDKSDTNIRDERQKSVQVRGNSRVRLGSDPRQRKSQQQRTSNIARSSSAKECLAKFDF